VASRLHIRCFGPREHLPLFPEEVLHLLLKGCGFVRDIPDDEQLRLKKGQRTLAQERENE
jgi:hypothetical protein